MTSSIHIIPSLRHVASGPSYTVPRLCTALESIGNHVSLLVGDAVASECGIFKKAEFFERDAHFGKVIGSSNLLERAIRSVIAPDVIVHNHSLWMHSNTYAGHLKKNHAFKLITSPRGTLAPWALKRKRLVKFILWHIGQKNAVFKADLLHATSEDEFLDIRKAGYHGPVAVIPNGVDLPTYITSPENRGSRKRLLYLGRLHPVKGLEELIAAWSMAKDALSDWELHLVGPGEPTFVEKLNRLARESTADSVLIRPAVYGDQKSLEYQSANAYVLASHTENFAMTVAEAMSHRLPCIVSKGAPWEVLDQEGCGYWVENSPEALSSAIQRMSRLSEDQRREMGNNARRLVETKFSWNSIARSMSDVYTWLCDGGFTPSCIRT